MAEEYDPNEFAVRVSPELFEMLAGRARGRTDSAQSVKERTTEARVQANREDDAHMSLSRAMDSLDAKLSSAHVRLAKSADDLPCAKARAETIACLLNGDALVCKDQVDKFTACARRVSELREE